MVILFRHINPKLLSIGNNVAGIFIALYYSIHVRSNYISYIY